MKKLLLVIMIGLAATYVYLKYYKDLDPLGALTKQAQPPPPTQPVAENRPVSHQQIKSTVSKPPPPPPPPPANLLKDVADAQAKFEAVKAACLARLELDDQYRSARHDADEMDAKIRVLRAGNDHDALADMSQHWVEARGHLQTLQLNALAADPQVAAAAKELADRKAALSQQQQQMRK
jgi:hypothetical protein